MDILRNAVLSLADDIENASVDYRTALNRLIEIRNGLREANLEDNYRAHLDRAELALLQPFPNIKGEIRRQIVIGVPRKRIASDFGVSLKTLQRWIVRYGIRRDDLDKDVSDQDLDRIVTEIHRRYPSAGYKMMVGHLRSMHVYVKRRRVLASLRRVDPQGVLSRRLSLRTTRRRRYCVAAPNSLWHIDGNHKLIRIERLWRDVFENVLDLFYTTFSRLEVMGWLNPDKDTDLYALHRCYMPHVQSHLQQFQKAWNHHPLRTEQNKSPLQLWYSKPREQAGAEGRVDWSQPQRPTATGVYVPELELPRPLTTAEQATLPDPSVPFPAVLETYIETVSILRNMMDN